MKEGEIDNQCTWLAAVPQEHCHSIQSKHLGVDFQASGLFHLRHLPVQKDIFLNTVLGIT